MGVVETKNREVAMVEKILRTLAALSLVLVWFAPPALAEDTVRVRGTVERIDGPIFVVKTREGSEVKLTVTDNPLFVVIVPSKMSDIKKPSKCIFSRNRCAAPVRATMTGTCCPRAR